MCITNEDSKVIPKNKIIKTIESYISLMVKKKITKTPVLLSNHKSKACQMSR